MRRARTVKEGHGPVDAIRGKLPVPLSLPGSAFLSPLMAHQMAGQGRPPY